MKTRWPRRIIRLLEAIGILVVLILVLLHTPPAERYAFKQLQSYLRNSSGLDIQATGFHLNYFKGSVNLENLTLRSTRAPELPPFFRADHLYCNLGILDTLRGSLVIEALDLTKPKGDYFIGTQGQTNLPDIPSSSGATPDWLIVRANATDGSFQFRNLQQGISIHLPRWHLSLAGDRQTHSHQINFNNKQTALAEYHAYKLPIHLLEFSGALKKNVLQIESAQIAAAGSSLALKGTLTDFSKPELDLEFSPNLDLARITQIANFKERAQGSVTGKILIRSRSDSIHLLSQLRGSGIHTQDFSRTGFTLDASTEWNPASRKLTFHSFELDSPEGSLKGRAALYPGNKWETNSINSIEATLRNLNLISITHRLRLPFNIASSASGKFSLQWRGAFALSKLAGSAHLNLAATRTQTRRNLLPISATADLRLQSNRILGNLQSFDALGTQASGQFTLQSFREIEGRFQGAAPNLTTLMRQLSWFLGTPGDSPLGTQLAGPLSYTIQAGGRLNQPNLAAVLDTPSLEVAGLGPLNAQTNATFQNSQIAFQSTITLPNKASIAAKGDLDLSGQQPILNLNADTDRATVDSLSSILGYELPATGQLAASLHLQGPIDTLSGEAFLTGDNLSLYEEPLGHLEAHLLLSDNSIRSRRFLLRRDPQNSSSDILDAQFSYAIDSGQFQLEANGKSLALKQSHQPDGGPAQGIVDLLVSGTGTLQNPSIDIQMETDDVKIMRKSMGRASVTAMLRNEGIKIEASVPRLNFSSTTNIGSREPYPFITDLRLSDSNLSLLGLKWREQPLTGSLGADIQGSGNLKELARAQITAHIQKLQVQAGKLQAHTLAPSQIEYRNDSIEITPSIAFAGSKSLIELAGKIPLRETAPEGTLQLKGRIDLTDALEFFPAPQGSALTGMLNLDFALEGVHKNFEISGGIQLDNGSITIPQTAIPITNVTIRAAIQHGGLVLQKAEAAWGQGSIHLTGEFPFGLLPKTIPLQFSRKQGPAQFVLDLENLTPESTGFVPKGITGLVSLHATGQTNRLELRALTAAILFRDLGFKADNLAFNQKDPSLIEIHDGIASISRLALIGPQTNIEASGSAGIYPKGPLNLQISGSLNTGLLAFFNKDLKAAGNLQIQMAAAGTLSAPSLSGHAEMNNGKMSLRDPRIVADDIKLRLNLSPEKVSIQECTGILNGGAMTMEGSIGYRRGLLNDIKLTATLQDFFLNAPEGLKSSYSGTLTMTSTEDTILIGGNLRVLESSYRESIQVGSQLINYLKSQQAIITDQEPDPFLERIRLNISLRTTTPLLVQNNMARVEASATNLRIVGSFYEPSLVGRITLNEGGEIILNQQKYYISRGVITLVNQNRIEPELNIQAQTRIGTYDITLQLVGNPDRLTTLLTSDPPQSERDILSLLLTGKTVSETQGSEMQMARTQALSLLAGQAGEELTNEARKALRLSTFRIDPGLISSESDPGARLTIGQDITRNFSLVYSMNLVNGGDQIWAAQYNLGRRLTTQATKQQDNSYRFEFRQDLRLGGSSTRRTPRAAASRLEIGSIQFQGNAPYEGKSLLNKLKTQPGDKYNFPKIQKGLDRLQDFYVSQKRLEADIRLQRATEEKTVDLKLNIISGPVVDFEFEGFPASKNLREIAEKAWTEGAFETERLDEAAMAIRRYLTKDGYLQVAVTFTLESAEDRKLVHFRINPGVRYPNIPISYPGASEIESGILDKMLDAADLKLDIFVQPEKAVDYVKNYYYAKGYLQAQVDSPQIQLDPATGTGQVSLPIKEGPLFTIGELGFIGNKVFDYDQLWVAIPTSSGSIYAPDTLRDSAKALESLYHGKGYNDASITFRVLQDSRTAHANVTFQITERRQSIIRDIAIEGNEGTSKSFVSKQLDFKTGDTLDFERINEARRRLYAAGVYSSVDFQAEEIAPNAAGVGQKNMRIRLRLRENRPYRLQYGLFYDTERGIGGLLEGQHLNVLGRASNLGFRLRYDTDLKEGRIYYNQPFVTKIHLKMDATAFAQEETRAGFSAKRIGFSLTQERALSKRYRFDYGYRYDYVHWKEDDLPPDPTIFQANAPVARLIGTFSRDTRDSVLDPTRGEFASHAFEFGPRLLGSEIGFARYSGQYFRYVPLAKYLGRPIKDREGNPLPTNLVYAGALRLGLTSAFGGKDLISPERFYAGGGTTMRGFEQYLLGPLETLEDGSQRPLGGEAMFLFNNEIRFPIAGILHGVGFLDIGNVYAKMSDFNFNLRKTAGAGLRLKIKFIPLRFDYGFKLDRRPGESGSEFFFSIGQAF
jgi:outer membrane protein assembly complex protein YaeT